MTCVLRGLFVWFLCSCVYRKCERVHCVYIMCIHPGSWESQYPNSCVGPSMQVLVRNLSLKLLWETPHPVSCGDPSPRSLWGTPHPGFCGELLTQASVGNPSPRFLLGTLCPVPCGEPLTLSPVGSPSPRPLWGTPHPGSWVEALTYAPGRSPVNSLAPKLPLIGVISSACVGVLSRVKGHLFISS